MATELVPHRFTVDEYYRMAEVGILSGDSRVELIDGQVVERGPVNPPHASTVERTRRLLERAVGEQAMVRTQNPLALGQYDEPQPDVALVTSRADFYATAHPTAADTLLVIEVADSTLAADRRQKVPLYAAAGIREAWVLNLPQRLLEVHQEPRPAGAAGYAVSHVYRPGERVAPEAFPDLTFDVGELLPPEVGQPDGAEGAVHR